MKQKVKINISHRRTVLYLEVYIKENGELIFTPLTKNTSLVFKAISRTKECLNNVYCG